MRTIPIRAGKNEVADNIIISNTEFHLRKPGVHVLKFWMVDPGIVLQKIVVGFTEVNPSYLGPPETWISKYFTLRCRVWAVLSTYLNDVSE